jgi:hypothetical protein
MANGYNLWPFGIVCGYLVHFPNLDQEKIWQPWFKYYDDLMGDRAFVLKDTLSIPVESLADFRTNPPPPFLECILGSYIHN